MAEEIALYQQVIVKREDRDFLLKIRNGEFEFDELMRMVEEKMELIKLAYEKSTLLQDSTPKQSSKQKSKHRAQRRAKRQYSL